MRRRRLPIGGTRLPDSYIEIGRWSLDRASLKERLLAVLVGLVSFVVALSATTFIVGTATGPGETTMGGGTFLVGMVVGLSLIHI